MAYFKRQINRLAKKSAENSSIILALLMVGFMFVYYGVLGNKPNSPEISNLPTPLITNNYWKIYQNQEFNFEIKYPDTWDVAEFPNSQLGPIFNFYPKETVETPPFIHFSDTNHVSVYPFGVPTEGINGEYRASSVSLNERPSQAIDFILENSMPWATFISFENKPSSWQESGFIFAGAKMKDLKLICMREDQPIPLGNCDPFTGDLIIRSGEIDQDIRNLQEMILASFKFLKD